MSDHQAFTEWLAERSVAALRDIIESQSDDLSVQKGLLLLLIALSDEELAEFIIDHCETHSLRAEFDSLQPPVYPDTAKGIPKRNA